MTQVLFLCLALMALLCPLETVRGAEVRKEAAGGPRAEKYFYEAVLVNFPTGLKDLVEMEVTETEEGIDYHSKVISHDSTEDVSIQMDRKARFVAGTRSAFQSPDKPVSRERIWRDRNRVFVERATGGEMKRKEHRLRPDRELAVDGSLLCLLRFFPFGEEKVWNLFMVDFSGYSTSVMVLQEGREKITVPAGEFECYRLAVVVNIPILKPRITYWLWTQKPHFLVKHQGKRGPFTSSFTTSLVSFQYR